MAKDLMRYDKMVETALRSVVKDALRSAAQNGLPGDHHFYITFRTQVKDVGLTEYLKDRYPKEMTIVLQHQFYGLDIREDGFDVTLSFNNVPERLSIPFEAITIFADPSVNFALQFQSHEEDLDDEDPALLETTGEGSSALSVVDDSTDPNISTETGSKTQKQAQGNEAAGSDKSGEVVSLDQFRRK